MIIGGLEDTQKKNVDVRGTTRTSIPKSHKAKASGDMNKQIVELAKLVDEATSRINYKKAAVARPQMKGGNQQPLVGTMAGRFIATQDRLIQKRAGLSGCTKFSKEKIPRVFLDARVNDLPNISEDELFEESKHA